MCHKYTKYFLACITSLFALQTANAQDTRGENLLYSRYGIGELKDGTNIQLRGMGSVSAAYAAPFSVNTINPASYTSLLLTTYEVGGTATSRTVTVNGSKYSTGGASLSYINIGIPVNKHLAFAFGLKPVSTVSYKMQDTATIAGLGTNAYQYAGLGGTNYSFVGAAGKIGGLSLGVNFGYIFGTTEYSSTLTQTGDTLNYLSSVFDKYTRVGNVYFELGGLYDAKLNKNYNLHIGATLNMKQTLGAHYDQYGLTSRYVSDAGVYEIDTVTAATDQKGTITMPATASFGIQLIRKGTVPNADLWNVGISVTGTKWSQFRNNGVTDSVTDQSWKASIGAEWTPNPLAQRKYLQRITYRAGFYYGKDFVYLRNTDIKYYAFTAGVSLPFRRASDRIHFALEAGKRGTQVNGLANENFVRFSVAASLNAFTDKWFVKRRYD